MLQRHLGARASTLCAALLLASNPGLGADRFALCPPFLPELPPLPALGEHAPPQTEADQARFDGQTVQLQGSAQLRYGEQRLLAERIDYRLGSPTTNEQVDAQGNVRYWDSQRILFADKGRFQPQQQQGEAEAVRFWLPAPHFSGQSTRVERLDAQRDVLHQVSLSSCPLPKDDQPRDWTLDARQIDLNHATGRGVARDAWLHFKGVPLMYAPYFDFPLDERRASGFLYPTFNYNSKVGASVTVPYYWNIAPERDATLTLRPMTQRGIMLGGEYRQIWQDGGGQVRGNWLPHDNDSGQDNRYFYDVQARQQIDAWSSSLALRRVSDFNYMRDFGTSLLTSNLAYLESHASLSRGFATSINDQSGAWNVQLLAQQYQNLSYSVYGSSLPYRRLPQLLLTGQQALGGGLQLGLLTEAVRFQSEYAGNAQGERYSVLPTLSLPLGERWYSITPSVGLASVSYQIDQPGTRNTSVAVSSLDTRFFFERFGETLHQQLEPRLYYLYVPYTEQNAPLFDTAQPLPSLARLFSTNRFIGRDRQGDANSLSYALTWRAIDAQQGFERLSLGVGQRYRFAAERVTLNPGDPIEPRGAGEAIVELGAGFNREWSARLTASESQTYATLGYRPRPAESDLPHQQRALNLYYGRQTNQPGLTDLNQVGVSWVWPLDRQWHVLGHVAQDLDARKPVQLLAGIGYESCCWRMQLGMEYYAISNPNPDAVAYTTAALLQFELKGLGALGSQADRRFERAILGYQAMTPGR